MIKFEHLERTEKGKHCIVSLVLQCFRIMGKGKKKLVGMKLFMPLSD